MEETQTWKDVVYTLFVEGELNQRRCMAIMHNNDVDTSGIVSAVIEGAVNRGETENIGTLSINVTDFVRGMETYERELGDEETKKAKTIRKFRSQITLFIRMYDTEWDSGARLSMSWGNPMRNDFVRGKLAPKYHPYFNAIVEERFKPKGEDNVKFLSDQKCRLCKRKFYGFEGHPGLAACVDCVETYIEALCMYSEEERLKYEADMKDFMEFMTNDKFADGKKRKRDE
jgi:hypothetical protein